MPAADTLGPTLGIAAGPGSSWGRMAAGAPAYSRWLAPQLAKSHETLTPPLKSPRALISLGKIEIGGVILRVQP